MMPQGSGDVTQILAAVSRGDEQAAQRLFPIVYDKLRRLAARYLRGPSPGHTLQPTALVHEAYLKLVGQDDASWTDRGHFFAVAAVSMRHILVNHAKAKGRQKRDPGPGAARLPIEDIAAVMEERAIDLVALDEALSRLASIDPQQARIVELRFFGGLSVDETAQALGVSVRTVHREWTTARLWQRGEIHKGDTDAAPISAPATAIRSTPPTTPRWRRCGRATLPAPSRCTAPPMRAGAGSSAWITATRSCR
jgi:RNA polymerase sigma factor (TIGR02999 family)